MSEDVDFEAEGLLDGVEGSAREARRALLEDLLADGVPLEELRRACAEDRLALLPIERLLAPEERYTRQEIADLSGVPVEDLERTRSAFGLPMPPRGQRSGSEEDLEMARRLRILLEAGVPVDAVVEFDRVVGRAMAQVAAAARTMIYQASLRPGTTERDVAASWVRAARELGPQVEPVLGYVFDSHIRELLSRDMVSAEEIVAGRTPGARQVTVAFADLVGFTRLGEQLPPEDLGALAGRLEVLAADCVSAPVTLVKTVGDAVMLVAPEATPLLEVGLELLQAADDEGDGFPQLRVGLAGGPALERAGDWFGRPVNLASRVTGVARAGSVLATRDVRDAAPDAASWSSAGAKHLRGVPGRVPLYRARPAGQASPSRGGGRS